VADLVEIKSSGTAEDKLSVAFLPTRGGTNIRLSVVTRVREQGQRTINELEAKIIDRAGKYIYGFDDDTLSLIVGGLLKEKGQTLAVAESCTGGSLGKIITDIPGSSDYFVGGIIAYSNEMKKKLLSVSDDILNKYGAVSEECACAMAEGVVKNLGASVGISITGVAGPAGGADEKPVGLVYIGLASPGKLEAKQFKFGNERDRNRERSAISALDMIRKHLLGIA
jgi:nicotinamide-nucleotide amidase